MGYAYAVCCATALVVICAAIVVIGVAATRAVRSLTRWQ